MNADDSNDDAEKYSPLDDFAQRVGLALSPYQLLEEYLKMYIEAAHLKIRLILRGSIPFRFPRKEYENAPMEWLIKTFKRHCDNDDLIKRLNAALIDRNYVAHKAIGDCMEHHHNDRTEIFRNIERIEHDGYELVDQLREEFQKLKPS
jgi:hypothetical protein